MVVIQSRRLVEIDAGDDWADKLLESKRLCAEVLLVYNSVEDGQLFGAVQKVESDNAFVW